MMSIRSTAQASARLAAPRPIPLAFTLRRTYAASPTSTPASTKPPLPLFGLDGTYASALYTAAAKSSTLDTTAKSLAQLAQLFKSDAKLDAILHAPTLSAADKSAIINELSKRSGAGADSKSTVGRFLATLAENNRLGLLGGVCEKFSQLMAAERGEVECRITSAAQLDSKTLSRLETAVSKSQYVGPGKKLKVTNKINPEIKGGLVVEIGDRTIDLSVSSQVAKMNKLLTDLV